MENRQDEYDEDFLHWAAGVERKETMEEKESKELINQIYDKLLDNVGMSEFHTEFPIDKLKWQFVDEGKKVIYLEFESVAYELTLKEVPIMGE
jgi:hypothetical protein